jgi:hypothetical protein
MDKVSSDRSQGGAGRANQKVLRSGPRPNDQANRFEFGVGVHVGGRRRVAGANAGMEERLRAIRGTRARYLKGVGFQFLLSGGVGADGKIYSMGVRAFRKPKSRDTC